MIWNLSLLISEIKRRNQSYRLARRISWDFVGENLQHHARQRELNLSKEKIRPEVALKFKQKILIIVAPGSLKARALFLGKGSPEI